MRKFLKDILLFFVILAAGIILLSITSFFMLRSVSFQLPADKTILVIGDSHTQCAVDDNILKQAANVSSSATSYLYTYVKLKRFVGQNAQIKTVILSYHYKSLDTELEQRWLYKPGVMIQQVPMYYCMMSNKDTRIFKYSPSYYISLLRMPKVCFDMLYRAKGNVKRLQYTHLAMGGFNAQQKTKLAEDIERRKDEPMPAKTFYSQIEHQYLEKIIAYCKAKNLELILLSTPVYHGDQYADVQFFEQVRQQHFLNVPYLNYSDMELADSVFADVNHLNADGARIFSTQLAYDLTHKPY